MKATIKRQEDTHWFIFITMIIKKHFKRPMRNLFPVTVELWNPCVYFALISGIYVDHPLVFFFICTLFSLFYLFSEQMRTVLAIGWFRGVWHCQSDHQRRKDFLSLYDSRLRSLLQLDQRHADCKTFPISTMAWSRGSVALRTGTGIYPPRARLRCARVRANCGAL